MNIINIERNGEKTAAGDNGHSQINERDSMYTERVYIHKHMDNTSYNSLFMYRWWKNVFDRLAAFFLIIVLSPLMAVVALIIRLDSPGSVVFRREQVGENGKRFTLYKFRTMQTNNNDYKYKAYLVRYILEDAPYTVDENGQGVYKVIDDPRVTRFGAILRKTNIDELLQLFNILKGEMSFIGPRPDIPFAVNMYHDWHLQRLEIKPGIAGLWQVSGRKECSFKEMVNLDIEYIKKQSLFLDIKIFILTIVLILKMDGS
jgi:lipopolysaccharide/colanic/teichoic acid biosynthesis glycosyltransferase